MSVKLLKQCTKIKKESLAKVKEQWWCNSAGRAVWYKKSLAWSTKKTNVYATYLQASKLQAKLASVSICSTIELQLRAAFCRHNRACNRACR